MDEHYLPIVGAHGLAVELLGWNFPALGDHLGRYRPRMSGQPLSPMDTAGSNRGRGPDQAPLRLMDPFIEQPFDRLHEGGVSGGSLLHQMPDRPLPDSLTTA